MSSLSRSQVLFHLAPEPREEQSEMRDRCKGRTRRGTPESVAPLLKMQKGLDMIHLTLSRTQGPLQAF